MPRCSCAVRDGMGSTISKHHHHQQQQQEQGSRWPQQKKRLGRTNTHELSWEAKQCSQTNVRGSADAEAGRVRTPRHRDGHGAWLRVQGQQWRVQQLVLGLCLQPIPNRGVWKLVNIPGHTHTHTNGRRTGRREKSTLQRQPHAETTRGVWLVQGLEAPPM